MDSFTDEVSGYYLRMLDYLHTFIKKGVDNNKFTEEDARQDLQIALWYSFACNNMEQPSGCQIQNKMPKDAEPGTTATPWH